jgi:hypothetical protein
VVDHHDATAQHHPEMLTSARAEPVEGGGGVVAAARAPAVHGEVVEGDARSRGKGADSSVREEPQRDACPQVCHFDAPDTELTGLAERGRLLYGFIIGLRL